MGVNDLAIHLERQSGVYHAGETIRGVVTVSNDKLLSTCCQGVALRFTGRSRCAWQAYSNTARGDGDNSKEETPRLYEGETVFREQIRTLYGDQFHTTCRPNAQGVVVGEESSCQSCTVTIPLKRAEEEKRLHLIIRVFDREKDEVLGESIVDASQMARSAPAPQWPFEVPMSIPGWPGDLGSSISLTCDIMNRTLHDCSSAAQEKALLALCTNWEPKSLVVQIRKINGLPERGFCGWDSLGVQVYRPPDEMQINNGRLPDPDDVELPTGMSTFSFSIPIEEEAPGSADIPIEKECRVRYDLEAMADTATSKQNVIVIPKRPLPVMNLLNPRESAVALGKRQKPSLSIFRRPRGLICFQVDRQAYSPGETINLRSSYVVNQGDQAKKVALVLCRYVMMQSCDYRHKRIKADVGKPLLEETCPPRSTMRLDGAPTLPVWVYPSFYGGRGRRTAVKWTYALELRILPSVCEKKSKPPLIQRISGNKTREVVAEIPILVCAAPPCFRAIRAASKLAPAVNQKEDAWMVLSQAIHGVGHMTMQTPLHVR